MGIPPTEDKGSLGRVVKLELKSFLNSSAAGPLVQKHKKDLDEAVRLFLECVYVHHDTAPKDLEPAELREVVLETLPRRFTGSEGYLAYVPEMVKAYFDYLQARVDMNDPQGIDRVIEEMRESFVKKAKKVKEKDRIPKDESRGQIRRGDGKVGRNDPCPCGSGKKYKKCCFGK